MALSVETPPVNDPLSLDSVKEHLRLLSNKEDGKLLALIKAATKYTENFIKRALIEQELEATFDYFPGCRELLLERPPLISVESVQYVESDGDTITLPSNQYSVIKDTSPGKIELIDGLSWPTVANQANAVTVNYTAGYGTEEGDVPEDLRLGMLTLIGHWYANREAFLAMPGAQVIQVPDTYEALVGPYRVYV